MSLLKVSAGSDPTSTAGALATTIREEGRAELQMIGPRAVNQAVKAIAIARGYIAPSGMDLISIPSFVDVMIAGEAKTAIRLLVRPRHPLSEFATQAEPCELTRAPYPLPEDDLAREVPWMD